MNRFLIVGQTGVGKSSFINAVFGLDIASTSDFEACTKVVERYVYQSPFGEICLIDTPGLSEDSLELDRSYLKMVRASIKSNPIDCVLYLSPLSEKRFRSSEMSALSLITKELGKSVWKKTWLVLTFAASVDSSRFDETCDARIQQLSNFLLDITFKRKKQISKFQGFERIILIDNIIPNWSPTCRPIDEIFDCN